MITGTIEYSFYKMDIESCMLGCTLNVHFDLCEV